MEPLLGYNVASIVVNMLFVAFFAVVGIGIGFLVYAAKQLKKHEPVEIESASTD